MKRLSILLAFAAAIGSSPIAAAAFVSPRAGGTGGDQSYDLDCGADAVLTGFSGRWGSWMDSIGIICRKVNPDGTLGSSFTRGPRGGSGGSDSGNPSCDAGNVVQRIHPSAGTYVDEVVFVCGAWSPSSRTVARPASSGNVDFQSVGAPGVHLGSHTSELECPTDGKPAKAIRGKHGIYVDSISLVCDDVTFASTAPSTSPKAGAPSGAASAQGAKGGAALAQGAAAGAASAKASVIRFDEAPAAGSAVALSASRGGEVTIRASGGTAALSMTLSVMDGSYRPFFELVSPPASTVQAAKPGKVGAPKASPQSATITRSVRMKPGAPMVSMGAPAAISIVVMVQDASGATAARTFLVQLLP